MQCFDIRLQSTKGRKQNTVQDTSSGNFLTVREKAHDAHGVFTMPWQHTFTQQC